MVLKFGVLPRPLLEPLCKAGDFEEPRDIMQEYFLRKVLVRKIVPLCSFGYAGLKSTFDGVTRQIVCAIEPPTLKQCLGILQPRLGQRLQFFSIHYSLCKL